MKCVFSGSALLVLIASSALAQTRGEDRPDPQRALVNTYCVTCHNAIAKTGGLALDGLDLGIRGKQRADLGEGSAQATRTFDAAAGQLRNRRRKKWIRSLPGWRTRSTLTPKVRRRAMCRSSA